MNKRISIGAAIALVILTATLTVSITMVVSMRRFNTAISDLNKRQAEYDYLVDIDKAIRQHYYGTIDEENLRLALAKGMANGLGDPYAAYLTAEEYKSVMTKKSGSLIGFGLEIAENRAGQKVITLVYTDSPAEKVGLTSGMVLTKLDDTDATTMTLAAVQKKLNSAEAALLTTMDADGNEAAYKITATTVNIVSVTGQMNGQIGYIRFRSFCDNTAAQFRTVYDKLLADGATGFIFDVRDVSGGSIEAVCGTLNYLLPSGQYGLIETAKGDPTPLVADGGHTMQLPSAVLINGNTNGEAVFFAAVMQVFASSATVGTTTAGRATVQDYYLNSVDGAAIRLTYGKMRVFSSELHWEKVGWEPTVVAENYAAETLLDLLDPTIDHARNEAVKVLEAANGKPVTPTTTTVTTTDTSTEETVTTTTTAKTTAKKTTTKKTTTGTTKSSGTTASTATTTSTTEKDTK